MFRSEQMLSDEVNWNDLVELNIAIETTQGRDPNTGERVPLFQIREWSKGEPTEFYYVNAPGGYIV